MRQANTTFVNLRAALDDLDPLVETAKPATKNLAPFLSELRPVLSKAVPVFKNLRLSASRKGFANDTAEALTLPAAGPGTRVDRLPARRNGHRSLPADAELRPQLHPGHLQRLRQTRPDHRLLRRQRPLRARPAGLQHLQAQRRKRRARTDQAERTVRRRTAARPRCDAPCPGGRNPVRLRRLQPVRRPALRGLGRQLLRMQPGGFAMRRWLIPGALVAAVVLVVVLLAGGGGSNGYVVRGIFDSGGFMVAGEEVRVAGATVGEIESVGVTMPGEVDGYKNGKPISVPGKAVIAMKIEDPGFQDFRSDASCLIRPQSLIGEKFVDCRPTLPRAPGSQAAAAAEEDRRRRAGSGPVPAAVREQQHQRRPRPDQQHQPADLRAALPPDPQRTRRRPRRPRRRPRGSGQAGEPGAARRRSRLRHPQRPARPARPALRRLREDPRAALARAAQRRRLLRQRRRGGAGERRKGRRRRSLAAQAAGLPARAAADDGEPSNTSPRRARRSPNRWPRPRRR